jgi:DNA-binding response OmpR family regulator
MLSVSPTTVAIVDGNNLVTGRALQVLLEGAGYEVRSLAQPVDGDLGELLEGVRLLLLPHTLGPEARGALVSSIAEIPELVGLPIVALTSYGDEAAYGDGLAGYVPWPAGIEALVERIEAALKKGPVGDA